MCDFFVFFPTMPPAGAAAPGVIREGRLSEGAAEPRAVPHHKAPGAKNSTGGMFALISTASSEISERIAGAPVTA